MPKDTRRFVFSLTVLMLLATTAPAAHAIDTTAPAAAPAHVAAPVAAPAPVSATPDPASASLRATEEAFAKAFADRNRDHFASFLHPGAVFAVTGATPLRGKQAVMDTWSQYLAPAKAPFSWRPVIAEAHDGMGVTAGPVYSADGKWVGNFSSVWQQQADGDWKIVFDGQPPCGELGKPAATAPTNP